MSMIIDQQFRDLVNAEIERQGISRSDLAERMGATRQYVTDYLNGRKSPGAEVMERFFRSLGLQPRLVTEPLISAKAAS